MSEEKTQAQKVAERCKWGSPTKAKKRNPIGRTKKIDPELLEPRSAKGDPDAREARRARNDRSPEAQAAQEKEAVKAEKSAATPRAKEELDKAGIDVADVDAGEDNKVQLPEAKAAIKKKKAAKKKPAKKKK